MFDESNLKLSSLLIASRNTGKAREWQQLLEDSPFRLQTLRDFPACPEAPETGDTFEENALMKARFYAQQTNCLTFADDSGLEVNALNSAPGIRSARYGAPHFTDAERTDYLLKQLDDATNRTARFVCVVAFVKPYSVDVATFRGTCEGSIAHRPRGANGFGYDPVFIPEGYDKTFAELDAKIKNHLSHRAQASRLMRRYLARMIQ